MELNELRIDTKVIQAGSFTKAAEALNSHKAVLSRSLSQLEAKLGVRLLERSTRSLRPTEIGQTVYERALVILAAVEDVEQLAQQVWQEPKGLLRITCGVEFGILMVNDWINRYLKAYPQMNIGS
jgi:DNA-binding transcriptional LysR family regulator